MQSISNPLSPPPLKQYPCLIFHQPPSPPALHPYHLTLTPSTTTTSSLPSLLYDSYSQNPQIYCLQWRNHSNTKVQLFLRKSQEDQWMIFLMNCQPKRVFVTDRRMFVFGDKEIAIVKIEPLNQQDKEDEDSQVRYVGLESGCIVDAQLASTSQGYSGVYVVYFDQRIGYTTKTYSRSSRNTLWQKMLTHLKLPFTSFTPYTHFQTILPNILSIAIHTNTLIFYDLNRMTPTLNLVDLTPTNSQNRITIKWRIGQAQGGGFSDSIVLYIGRGKIIEKVVFKFDRNLAYKNNDMVSIDQYIGGDVIDWNRIAITKDQNIIQTQTQIDDLQIYQNQLIYTYTNHNSPIPIITTISLNNNNQQNTEGLVVSTKIISQQMQIWKKYDQNISNTQIQRYNDQVYHEKVCDGDSVNGKKKMKERGYNLSNMVGWKKNNGFRGFIVVAGQLYIVRKGSVSVYLPINEIQYQLELYTEHMHKTAENNPSNLSHNNNPQHKATNYPLQHLSHLLSLHSHQSRLHLYQKVHKQIRLLLQNICPRISTTTIMTSQLIQSLPVIVASLVQDKIQYFQVILTYGREVLGCQEKDGKNGVIEKMVAFVAEMYREYQLTIQLGNNPVQLFVRAVQQQLSNPNQLTVSQIFIHLFQNLFPTHDHDHYYLDNTYNYKNNLFLDHLITLILENHNNDQLIQLIQKTLKKIVMKIFIPNVMAIEDFAQLAVENQSVLQSYFISHPEKTQLQKVIFYVLRNLQGESALRSLRKVQQFIIQPLTTLLQFKTYLNQPNPQPETTTTTANFFSHLQSKIPSYLAQKSTTTPFKTRLTQQFLLYTSEETFVSNLQKISFILSQLRKNLPSTKQQFQKRHQNFLEIYTRQLSLDILNCQHQHILEIEEVMLQEYTQMFDLIMNRLSSNAKENIKIVNLLQFLLKNIQKALSNYTRYYHEYYRIEHFDKKKYKNFYQQFEAQLQQEEQMMTDPKLEQNVMLMSEICSTGLIQIVRILLKNEEVVREIGESKENMRQNGEGMLEMVFRVLLMQEKPLNNGQIDTFYYFLIKKGQKYLRDNINKYGLDKVQALITNLQQKRIHDILLQIFGAQPLPVTVRPPPPPLYLNPFFF